MRHERVLVISPRKSGTHLIQRVLARLGYSTWGDLAASVADLPRFSVRERLALARQVMTDADVASLDAQSAHDEFIRKTNWVWIELARSWGIRLGVNRGEPCQRLMATRPELWTMRFSETPANICWIYHSVDVSAMESGFLAEWQENKKPAVILNLRDPRDALVSMANFLADPNGRLYSRAPEAQIYRPVFSLLGRIEDRVDRILTDPCLPLFQDYERAVSFFTHPDVCNVTFEELVGPDGGGSRTKQEEAVTRLTQFLGIEALDPREVTNGLFNRQSYTFHKGQIGAWRTTLTSAQQAAFHARYGLLVTALGYG